MITNGLCFPTCETLSLLSWGRVTLVLVILGWWLAAQRCTGTRSGSRPSDLGQCDQNDSNLTCKLKGGGRRGWRGCTQQLEPAWRADLDYTGCRSWIYGHHGTLLVQA
ncbi:hypothetical protein B0T19DRAFT_274868 [Cercophora scortea]|uniref:Uncharacterized protein n=1 Tax=Cercophora scortea TaxID=314031 RepID=A0AAE0I7I6_9PEZI|nr:hypothetical protein B0T19DRAFT_274868 [Cercophora scortea]